MGNNTEHTEFSDLAGVRKDLVFNLPGGGTCKTMCIVKGPGQCLWSWQLCYPKAIACFYNLKPKKVLHGT